jgi:hypothetical protein
VNHLDEALRILKNEVRKKQPVSVCLEADFTPTLREAVERGLQPDLLVIRERSGSVDTLIERGALIVERNLTQAPSLLEIFWSADSAPALWLPKVDVLAAQVLPDGDPRSRWLKFAPRYLGRTMAAQHYLHMSAEEAQAFDELVDEATASGAIGARIKTERRT